MNLRLTVFSLKYSNFFNPMHLLGEILWFFCLIRIVFKMSFIFFLFGKVPVVLKKKKSKYFGSCYEF